MSLWSALGSKGKLATIIGVLFAIPANAWAIWKLYAGVLVTVDELWVVVIMNIASIAWFILPSEISLKSGKGLELTIKD